MKKLLSIVLALVMLLALLPASALADENIVNNILLEIVAPEPGHHATAPTVYTGNGSYAVNSAYWHDVSADRDMTAEDKFYGGKTYEAVLDLIVPGVGRFADADVLNVKVNNKTLTTSYFELHDMGSHLIVTFFFQNLPYPTINTCDVNVIEPEIGAAPSQALTINDEGAYTGYDGGIIWTDENGDTPTVFEGGGTYTVEVRLTADPGAKFAWYNDRPDVGVTLNGRSVSEVEQLGQAYATGIRFRYTFPTLPGGKPVKIEITTPPNKVAYLEGEPFDPAGVVITATYKDGSTAVLTDDAWEITNNGLDALTPDKTMIHFSLKGTQLLASQPITVTSIPKTVLSAVSLTAEAPALGAHPDFNLTLNTPGCHVDPGNNTGGFVNGVAWGETEALSIKDAESAKTLTAADTFSAGKYIVLTFYLEAEKGYTFDSSAAVTVNGKEPFFSFGGESSFVAMFVFDPLKAEVKPETKTIDAIALTVTAPVVGANPAYAAAAAGPHYAVQTESKEFIETINGVGWIETDGPTQQDIINNGKLMTAADSFREGKYYYVGVILKTEDGYSFGPNLETSDVTINGEPCFDFGVENGEGMAGMFFGPLKKEKTPKTLVSITVTAQPAKTEYSAGQSFDPAGMTVIAAYSDGSTAEIIDYTVAPEKLAEGDKSVIVSYTEDSVTKTATVAVTVKPKDKTDKKENPFTDVKESDYFYDAVIWAYYAEPQVTNGIGNSLFAPDSTVKRCEAVTFLWRAVGCPEPTKKDNPFVDVAETDYFYKPVLWALEKGITRGTDDTHFTPEQTCSTAHIITFLYRALGIGDDGWYAVAEAWAKGAGLLNGLSVTVAPGVDCPRRDVVLFIFRAVGK